MGDAQEWQIEVRRSARRKRTVSAHREGDRIIISAPERMSRTELERHTRDLVARIERRVNAVPADADLFARALALRAELLPEAPEPHRVEWSERQERRWGSCTPLDRSIRVSARLRRAPGYVLDYVLVHELAHLLELHHGPAFTALEQRFADHARARAFLEGADFAKGESSQW